MTVAVTVIRRHGFIGHFDGLFPELAVLIIILHIIAAQIEIRTDIRRNDAYDAVPALDHDAAARCIRYHKMTVLPVLRNQDAGFRFPDRLIYIRTVVQHIAQQHAGPGREAARLFPFFDINTLNGYVKALFIDPVHTLVRQNIQQAGVKSLLIRTAPLQQRIVFIAPDCVSHRNRFILAFRFAVKDNI